MTARRGIRLGARLSGVLLLLASTPVVGQDPENLIASARLRGALLTGSTSGLASALLPEGSPPDQGNAVFFDAPGSLLLADLGATRGLSRLLVQADHASGFLLEASSDGQSWSPLWRIPPVLVGVGIPPMGQRTRERTLPEGLTARYLRLTAEPSATTARRPSVSRLWIAGRSSKGWPPRLDYSRPRSRPPLLPWIDLSVATLLGIFLSSAALVAFTWVFASERGRAAGPGRHRVLLGVTVVLAVVAWPNFLNFHWGSFYHPHDVFHYFLGAKYTTELRYEGLYDCALVAQSQDGRNVAAEVPTVRDLSTNTLVPSTSVVADPPRCTSRFTSERWRSFSADVRWFRERFATDWAWRRAFVDHGFNASPAWMILGTPLANLGPATDAYVTGLALIDVALLAASAGLLWRGFGFRAAAVATVFFCLNPIAFFRYTGGSLLRYDWLFWICLGLYSLRRERPMLAGFSLAYAALLRVFPGFLLAGLGLKIVAEAMDQRSLRVVRDSRRLAAGVALALVVLLPLSLVASGRLGAWGEFADNSARHLETESANFIGLAPLLEAGARRLTGDWAAGDGAGTPPGGTVASTLAVARVAVCLAVLLLYARVVRHRPLWLALVLAICLIPFFATLSNYYYVLFALFGALWPVRRASAYALIVLCWISWLPMAVLDERVTEYLAASLLTLAFAVAVLTLSARAGASPSERLEGARPAAR